MLPDHEVPITHAVLEYVTTRLALGLPGFQRTRLPVLAFAVEVLDYDDEVKEPIVTAAGPLELDDNGVPRKIFLKVIVPMKRAARFKWQVIEDDRIRAAYIIDNGDDVGTCKEVGAIAHA